MDIFQTLVTNICRANRYNAYDYKCVSASLFLNKYIKDFKSIPRTELII